MKKKLFTSTLLLALILFITMSNVCAFSLQAPRMWTLASTGSLLDEGKLLDSLQEQTDKTIISELFGPAIFQTSISAVEDEITDIEVDPETETENANGNSEDLANIIQAESNMTEPEYPISSEQMQSVEPYLNEGYALNDAMTIAFAEVGTLQEMINSADEGATIALGQDYKENIVIPIDKDLTIDLNGHKLVATRPDDVMSTLDMITVYGKLTVTDTAENGQITAYDPELEESVSDIRAVTVTNNAEFTLAGGTITGFDVVGNGGGVRVEMTGKFAMSGGTILGNTASEFGGGIFCYTSDNLSLTGGLIQDNAAKSGGGLTIYNTGDPYTISNMNFQGNRADENGGAIYVDQRIELTLDQVSIDTNYANNGAGLYFNTASELTLPDGIIIQNNEAGQYGGGLYFAEASTLNMNGAVISGNSAGERGGGAFLYKGSTINMDSGTISGNHATYYGGGIDLGSTSTANIKSFFNLSGGTIQENYLTAARDNIAQAYGGGVYLSSYSVMDITGADTKIINNSGASYGGGLYFGGTSVLTFADAEISGNAVEAFTAAYGGGFYMANSSTFTMTSGKIINNQSLNDDDNIDSTRHDGNGAGLTMDGGSSKTVISGGEISNNTATGAGGGFYNGGTFTIEGEALIENNNAWNGAAGYGGTINIDGGTVQNNHAGNEGGGFYSTNLNISEGIIQNNTAGTGGAARIGTKLTMSGGEVCNNSATGSSGAFYFYNGICDISGGKIIGNKAGSYAGAIYLGVSNTVKDTSYIRGDAQICGNEATTYGGAIVLTYRHHLVVEGGEISGNYAVTNGGGIYQTETGTELYVTGGRFLGNRAKGLGNDLYVTSSYSTTYPRPRFELADASTMVDGTEDSRWLEQQVDTRDVSLDNYEWTDQQTEIDKDSDTHASKTWAVTFIGEKSDPIAQIEDNTYPTLQMAIKAVEEGLETDTNILLLKDTLESITVPEGLEITVDLDGNTINAQTGSVIKMENDSKLTLRDSSGENRARIIGGKGTLDRKDNNLATGTYGGGIFVGENAHLVLDGGTITENKADYGAGVYLSDNATFEMNGGKVTANTGTGVYAYYNGHKTEGTTRGATFTLTNGEISKNTTSGIIGTGISTIHIAGGQVIDNTAANGAGIYLLNGNSAADQPRGKLLITEGEIVNNVATTTGGAANLGRFDFEMTGGEISNNAAATAAGVYYNINATDVSFSLTGGKIYDNKLSTTARGSDVYIGSNSKIDALMAAADMDVEGIDCWQDYQQNIFYTQGNEQDIVGKKSITYDLMATNSDRISEEAVARIDDEKYTSLQTAILADKSEAEDPTIYLLDNVEESVIVNGNRNIQIDLNGYTLSPYEDQEYLFYINDAQVTIKNEYKEDDKNQKGNQGKIVNLDPENVARAAYLNGGNNANLTELRLENITVEGFNHPKEGGAIYARGYNLSLDLEESIIQHNNAGTSGGGIYFYVDNIGTAERASSFVMNKSEVNGNTATTHGGGVYIYFGYTHAAEQSTLTINESTFSENTAGNSTGNYGGGLYLTGYSSTTQQNLIANIEKTKFENNTMLKGEGGGLYVSSIKTLNLTEVSLKENHAGTYGGGYFSGTSTYANFTLDNVTVENNQADTNYAGLGLIGNVTMQNSFIRDNKASNNGSGGGVLLSGAGDTKLLDTEITGNIARYGGGVYVSPNSTEKLLKGLTIKENTGISYGGGIYTHVSSSAIQPIIIEDCLIENNKAENGGGISTGSGSYYNLHVIVRGNTRILSNHATNGMGGGIGFTFNDSQSYFDGRRLEVEDGVTISGNTATTSGGGIYTNYIHTTIGKATISGNEATSSGGGIYVSGASKENEDNFIVNGATIESNKAANGGGIYVYRANSTKYNFPVRIQNALITNNTATTSGGGFYNNSNCLDTLFTGTEISKNNAGSYGGGIYNAATSYLNFESRAIYGNVASLGQDVYGAYTSGSVARLDLVLAQNMNLGDTLEPLGWLDETRDTVISEKIQGELVKAYALTLEYIQRDKEVAEVVTDSSEREGERFNSVQKAVDRVTDLLRDDDPSNDKTYVRMLDSSVENVAIPMEFTGILDLNGQTLEGYTTAISANGKLTIVDSSKNLFSPNGRGTVTGKAVTAGGALLVKSGGDVTLESGHIANSSVSIAVNSNTNGGAGVCVDSGTFRMTGGSIDHNNARYGSAVLVRNASSKFFMSGGVIEDNTSGTPTNGTGTIYINQGEARITGGTIRNNSTYSSGGAITTNSGRLTISGNSSDEKVEIYGNTARNQGGAIYVGGTTVTITNALIHDNQTTNKRDATVTTSAGGAIFVGSGTLTIGEGTEIRENQAARGGGIYQNAGNVYVMGGLITKNVAEMGGGAAQNPLTKSTFSMLQGGLYDNRSRVTSTGNDFYSQYEGNDVYDPSLNANTPRASLLAASEMGSSLYNVWKDDTYKGDQVEGDYILEGQYVKKSIGSAVNLQLTASYYDTPIESDTATDVKVTKVEISNNTDDGISEGMSDGTSYWDSSTEVKNAEKSALQLLKEENPAFSESDQTYIYNGEELNYIKYTPEDGEPVLYERDQIVSWSAGDDSNATNSLIRTFDNVQYTLSYTIQGTDLGGNGEGQDGNIEDSDDQDGGALKDIRLWTEMWVPLTSEELYFDTSSLSKMSGYVIKEQTDSNGEAWQVLQGYWEASVGKSGRATEVIGLKVRGMKNGDTFKPHFKAWVGGNEDNQANPATCQSKILTVSAYPKYNVTIDYNNTLSYTSYFDMENGTESTESDPKATRGTILGYGLTVELYNEPVNKGLKGIEVPENNLEFDVSLKGRLFLDGDPLTDEYVAPYFWAYKENENTDYGKPLNSNLYSFDMNWNDEDDLNRTTNFAYNAAPFNSVGNGESKSAYSGGGWTITGNQPGAADKELNIHAKVSGYSFSWDNAQPNNNSDGTSSTVFGSSAVKPFTAGYLQVLFPYQEMLDREDISGYVAIGMDASVSALSIKGISGNEPYSNTADETGLNNLNHYYEKGEANELLDDIALREMRYGDNYAFNEAGLYVYHGDEGGDTVTKFNHYLDRGMGELSGMDGSASTPIGSIVYVSGKGQFNSASYRTDDETDPKHYISDDDFNPLIHNKVEYNYMTAMNLLQKFDADAYTPVDSEPIIDYRVDSKSLGTILGTDNAFYIKTDETKTSWALEATEPYRNTTSYTLTVLYAAKLDGTNWNKVDLESEGRNTWEAKRFRDNPEHIDNDYALYNNGGVAEMDQYREENLIYFTTMEDLRSYFAEQGNPDGKCVAILYEFRDCCIRTGRYLEASAKVQVTDDFNLTGGTYATTNDVRVWSTYRPFYKESIGVIPEGMAYPQDHEPVNLYHFTWASVEYAENNSDVTVYGKALNPGEFYYKEAGTLTSNTEDPDYQRYTGLDGDNPVISCSSYYDNYKKSQYAYGTKIAGTHNGWYSGNTLLLYTLKPSIQIGRTDLEKHSNAVKESYDISHGEVQAGFRVVPSIKVESGVENHQLVNNGTQSVNVTIEIEIPQGLTYREGSIRFDYSKSGYTPETMQWEIHYDPEKQILTLTTFVSDIEKSLPEIFYDCDIDFNLEQGASLLTTAKIHTEYQEINQIAADTQTDTDTLRVQKPNNSGIAKGVGETLRELGEDLVYELRYMNDTNISHEIALGDILPYNGDGRGTSFHGGYRITGLDLTFANTECLDGFENNGALKVKNDKVKIPETDQASTDLMNGMNLETDISKMSHTKDNLTLSYDVSGLDLVQKETEKAGYMLYFRLPNLSHLDNDSDENVVKIRVTLSPKDSTGNLIDDNESTQTGNDRYFNTFFEQDFGASSGSKTVSTLANESQSGTSVIASNNVYIAIVNRTISGYVWLDQDHDGVFSKKVGDAEYYDEPLQNVEAYLVDESGQPAVNILDQDVLPCSTDANGYYHFDNLREGNYRVIFRDDDQNYSKENIISFDRLSVTTENTTALMGNKSGPNYISTYALDENPEPLDSGELVQNVSLPDKRTIIENYTGQFSSPYWNLGLYYYPAEISKDWNAIADAGREGEVTFKVKGQGANGEFEAGEYTISGPINGTLNVSGQNIVIPQNNTDANKPVALAEGPIDPSEWNGPSLHQYNWTLSGINLQAEDAEGPISYSIEETNSSFSGADSIDEEDTTSTLNENPPKYEFGAGNTPLGKLKVEKEVLPVKTENGLTTEDRETQFRYKVTLYTPDKKNVATDITGEYGGMTFSEGVAEFTLKHGESKLASDLPVGLQYVVEEDQSFVGANKESANHYDVISKVSDTGIIQAPTAQSDAQENQVVTAKFQNQHANGALKVSKTVSGTDANENLEFTFKVTLSNKDGADVHELPSGQFGGLFFTDGESNTFTLKHGQSVTATGLPAGLIYTVEETRTDGYTISYSGETGEITKNKTVEAKVTNIRDTGNLSVEKKAVGKDADTGKTFKFSVRLSDDTIEGTYGDMTFDGGVAEVEIKPGEIKTAKGLPTLVDYTIEELDDPCYTPSYEGVTGKITKDETKNAVITNTRDTGNLKVTKSVEGKDKDPNKEFTFTVTLKDTSINGTYGDMEFSDGEATITLKDGETKEATGLPSEVDYTIVESDDNDYTLTDKSDDSGTIKKNQTFTASFKNTRDTSDLTVSKAVSGRDADPNKYFTFTITLGDTSINGEYGDMTFTEGVATITLKDGQSKKAEGLPTNITYSIEESNNTGYTVGSSGASGTISKDTQNTAAFTNTRDHGSLEVTKTVTGRDGNLSKQFTFTVTLSDTSISGQYGQMDFTEGVATFTLSNGQNKLATELPTGIRYTVEETSEEGYTTTYEGETGTITKDVKSTAAFTNDRDTGNLSVTKTVTGKDGDQTKDFTFTVTLSDTSINGKYPLEGQGGMTFTNGVATFTLKHNGTMTATGLPTGITYTVEETAADGYTTTYTGETGTIEKGETATAAFTNARDTGNLTVTKTVSGRDGDTNKDFTFTVTLGDTTINGKYPAEGEGGMDFVNGVATFTLKDGESETATGLPTGITYTVEETAVNGYTTTFTGETGTIEKGTTATAAFTNDRDTGNLTVTKTVEGRDADSEKEFTFTVTLSDTTINGKYPAEGEGGMDFVNGVATFTLKDGESKTATGLPTLITYTVVERDNTGYTPSYTGETGPIEKGTTATAAFTNTRDTGNLSVTKTVTGRDGDTEKEFTFTVTLSDSSINGEYGDITFENGVANITLKHGQTLIAEGLPTGITYTVNETEENGYTSTPSVETGTIDKDETATATFTNDRDTGNLSVKKTVTGRDGNTDQEFTFTVTLSDTTINGTYGDMTFVNGVAEVQILHDETKRATGLPSLITYKIEETAVDGYTPEYREQEGEISKGETVEAEIINDRDTGSLSVSKTVTGRDGDPEQVFTFKVKLSDESINGTYGDMTFENGIANVEIKHDETKIATDLPTLISYTVEEVPVNGYTQSDQTGTTGTIEKDEIAEAEITNNRDTGNLSISKTVTGRDGDTEQVFTFTITLSDRSINGEYGNVNFKDGIAVVELKHGETIVAEGLPTLITYTVEETEADGYHTTFTGETGTIEKDTTKSAEFTNERETGDLSISKSVSGRDGDLDKEFTFTVTLSDERINGEYGDMNFTNGVAVVTLKHGETKEATGLPTLIEYSVVESDNDGYAVTSSGETGVIDKDAPKSAEFANERQTGNLIVSKTVQGRDGEIDKDFLFTVTLSDSSINGEYGEMTFENGVAIFTLKHGETKTATELPTLLTYEVTESDNEGYEVTSTNENSVISLETSEVEFINTRETGSLIVTKTVNGSDVDPEREFEFTVTLSDETINGPMGDMVFTNGVAIFKLRHGESKTALHLPLDIEYTVVEKEYPGYLVTKENDYGQIVDSNDIVASFINTRFEGEVSKTEVTINGNEIIENEITSDSLGNLEGPTIGIGDTITYQINWTNFSDKVADVVIKDLLDSGVDFVEASDDGVYDESTHTVIWTLPEKEPNDEGVVTLTVRVNDEADYQWSYNPNDPTKPNIGNDDTDEFGNRKADHRIVNRAVVEVENKVKPTNQTRNPLEGLYIEKIHAIVSASEEDGYKEGFFADGGVYDLPREALENDAAGFTDKFDLDTEENAFKKTFVHESNNTVRYYLKVTNNYKDDLEHVVIIDPVRINSNQNPNEIRTNFNGIAGVINNRPEVEGRTQQYLTVTPESFDPENNIITYKLVSNWNETWGDAKVKVDNVLPSNAKFISASYVKDVETGEIIELTDGTTTRVEGEDTSVVPAITLDGATVVWEYNIYDNDLIDENIMYLQLQFDDIDPSNWEAQSCGIYGVQVENIIENTSGVGRTNNIKAIYNQDDLDGDGDLSNNEGYLRWELDMLPGTATASREETSMGADGYPSNVQIVYFCWDMPESVENFTSWENTAYVETMANMQEKLKAKYEKRYEALEQRIAEEEVNRRNSENRMGKKVEDLPDISEDPDIEITEQIDPSVDVEQEYALLSQSVNTESVDPVLLIDESEETPVQPRGQILDITNDNSTEDLTSIYSEFGWRELSDAMIASNTVREVMNVGNLEISKKLVGENNQNKEFTFNISLDFQNIVDSGIGINEIPKDYKILDQNGKLTGYAIENGSGSFTLKDGQAIRIENLPIGTTFSITETNNSDYNVSGKVDYPDASSLKDKDTTGSVITGEITTFNSDVKVNYVNTRKVPNFNNPPAQELMDTGNLEVSKQVLGVENSEEEFNFIIRLNFSNVKNKGTNFTGDYSILDENGELTGFVIANGSGTFTLSDGQTIRIEDLPVGTKFTITETGNSAYTVTGNVNYPKGSELENQETKGSVITGTITTVDSDVTVLYKNTLKEGIKPNDPDNTPDDENSLDVPNTDNTGNSNQSSNNNQSSSTNTNKNTSTNTSQTTTKTVQTGVTTVGISPQTGVTGTMILIPLIGMAVGGSLLERNYRSKKKKDHKDSDK